MDNRSELKQIISRIIETDEKARAANARVRASSANAEAIIKRRVQAVHDEYTAQAHRRVEVIKKVETQYAEDQWLEIQARHEQLSAQLDARYDELGDEWVDDIVSDILGGD